MTWLHLTKPNGDFVSINIAAVVHISIVPTDPMLRGPPNSHTRIQLTDGSHQDVTEAYTIVLDLVRID